MPDLDRQLNLHHLRRRHWLDRFRHQLVFARGLARLVPSESSSWEALMAKAEALVESAVRADGSLPDAVAAAEALLAPISPVAKRYTMHCVGHAHLDMNWMWAMPETVAAACDTTRTVLALMEEFPDLRFSQSQVAIYQILHRHEPALLDQVRRRIAEGRWEVTAAHWVEGDRVGVGSEALMRQLLQARTWCREQLGLTPEQVPVDWVPDCFGHSGGVPAIDAGAAARYYWFMRGGGDHVPGLFRWRGHDGSELLAARTYDLYGGRPDPSFTSYLLRLAAEIPTTEYLFAYGLGDHGGGPTRRHLRMIADWDSWPLMPRWRFGTAAEYFARAESIRDRLPVVQGALTRELTGCLTSQTRIKHGNRRCEALLSDAEQGLALSIATATATATATAAGLASLPAIGRLTQAWQETLFNHFHDILPGSCVPATAHWAGGATQRVLADGTAVLTQALRTFATQVDTRFIGASHDVNDVPNCEVNTFGAAAGFSAHGVWQRHPGHGYPLGLVVVNPTPWLRREVITVRIWEGEDPWENQGVPQRCFRLRDHLGASVPAQRLDQGAYWSHGWVDVAVPVEIPAGGWRAYAIDEDTASATVATLPLPPAAATNVALARIQREGTPTFPPVPCHSPLMNDPAGAIVLDNGLLRIAFDRSTGAILSLVSEQHEQLAPGMLFGTLALIEERPNPMSAWSIGDARAMHHPLTCTELTVIEEGPYRGAVRVTVQVGHRSRCTMIWRVLDGDPRLHLAIDAHWEETGSDGAGIPRLALRLPTGLTDAQLRHEVPGGHDLTPAADQVEVATLRWAQVLSQASATTIRSWTIANDGTTAHRLDRDGALWLSLLRGSYAPDPLPDLGAHSWSFTIQPHDGHAPPELGLRHGTVLDRPLRTTWSTSHPGALPAVSAGITAAPDQLIVTQIKPAEDGRGLILRLHNVGDDAATGTITIPATLATAARHTIGCDLLERPLEQPSAVSCKRQGDQVLVHCTVASRGWATIRLSP